MKRSFNASIMRKVNRSMIFDLIRRNGPISRNQIAKKLKMSAPTVLRIVEELKTEDLVREIRSPITSRGRPYSVVELNSDKYALIGIDLGGTKLYGAITDLAGNFLNEIYIQNHASGGEENLYQLIDLIKQLLNTPLKPGQKIRGIGIGVPAVTRYPEGEVVWAPSLQWRNLPLKAILKKQFDYPVFVENDVNLAALGELWFGTESSARNIVCVSIGTGIGAGIIINGSLYRGHRFSAGEIGYLVPGRQFLNQVYDQFGALEYLVAGWGITNRAKSLILEKNIPLDSETITAETVFAEARRGSSWAVEIIEEMLDYLTIAMTAIIGLLDPEVIVLNGGILRSYDLILEPLRKRINGLVPVVPKIIHSSLGPKAPVLGAVMMVVDATTKRFTWE